MLFSRRQFLRTAGYSGAFLLARFQGIPAWGKPLRTSSCQLHTSFPYAPFIAKYMKDIAPGHDAFVLERYAVELESILQVWSRDLRGGQDASAGIYALLPASMTASPFSASKVQTIRDMTPLKTESHSFGAPAQMGRSEFIQHLNTYFHEFLPLEIAEFQLVGIEPLARSPLRLKTMIQYDLVGHQPGQRQERTGKWEINWEQDRNESWIIREWIAHREQRVSLKGSGFVDITSACMPKVASLSEQLNHGVYYWQTLLDGACGIDVYGNNGVAVGDSNGNGCDDIYVCQPAGLPNRLYRNKGDGTFEDVTETAGVGIIDGTSSALFLDLNNNGHQDLIVVRTDGPLLFQNQGDGTFQIRPDAFRFHKKPKGTFTAVAAADYNRDGLLDLYFCLYSYYEGLSEYRFPQPYYDAQNGPPNFLLKNHGNYVFEDVTDTSGINANNNRYSFACSWGDYNNDGWQDLYVANDFGRNNLYRNNGNGTFADVSAVAGVEDAGAGMSVCWFDHNNDGRDDLYVANMWSAAGKRITTQPEFLPNTDQTIRSIYQQDADGNCLLYNQGGDKPFRDETQESGTPLGRWAWSSDAWDIDHDGFPEIYIANGFISGPKKDNLSSFFWRQIVARSMEPQGNSKDYANAWSAVNELIRSDHSWDGYQRNNLYLNNRNGTFTEAAGVLGLDFTDDSRSYSLADIDGDGRVELILKNRTGPQLKILHNEVSPLGNSISFSLKGTSCNRDAIGAIIELDMLEGKRRATIRAGSGFLSQHSKTITIGLGSASGPLSAAIHWPSGNVEHFHNLQPQHRVEIVEKSSEVKQTPFRSNPSYDRSSAGASEETLPASFATWLLEPIAVPDFSLRDQNGKLISPFGHSGSFQLFVFWQNGCMKTDEFLNEIEKEYPLWAKHSLYPAIIATQDMQASHTYSFPIATADQATLGVYDIFYRYLFARHHDMPLPTAFLVDANGDLIRVYSGPFRACDVLSDLAQAPTDEASRIKAALPFKGRYFGRGMHHNYFTFGVAYLQFGYTGNAIKAFERSVIINPYYAPAFYNLGLIYLNQNSVEKAYKYLQQAVKLDPSDADAWNNLGATLGDKNEMVQARSAFEHALRINPTHLLALQNLVKLDNYEGRTADAISLLHKAIDISPSNPDLHIGLALIYFEEKDLVQASEEFKKAIEIQPANVEARNGLGVIWMKQGNLQQAALEFRKCISLTPDFDRPYLNLAVIYINIGQRDKAINLLAEYLKSHPDDDDIRNALSQLRQTNAKSTK